MSNDSPEELAAAVREAHLGYANASEQDRPAARLRYTRALAKLKFYAPIDEDRYRLISRLLGLGYQAEAISPIISDKSANVCSGRFIAKTLRA